MKKKGDGLHTCPDRDCCDRNFHELGNLFLLISLKAIKVDGGPTQVFRIHFERDERWEGWLKKIVLCEKNSPLVSFLNAKRHHKLHFTNDERELAFLKCDKFSKRGSLIDEMLPKSCDEERGHGFCSGFWNDTWIEVSPRSSWSVIHEKFVSPICTTGTAKVFQQLFLQTTIAPLLSRYLCLAPLHNHAG